MLATYDGERFAATRGLPGLREYCARSNANWRGRAGAATGLVWASASCMSPM